MADSPYDQWPARELPEGWETPKPAQPSPQTTVPQAIQQSLPTAGEAGNWLLPRAEYVGKRFLRGVSGPGHEQSGYPLWYADPGQRPDLATGAVGAFAEDLGRNPLLTAMTPVRSAISSAAGDLLTGFPAWERGAVGGLLGVVDPRQLVRGVGGALAGAAGTQVIGPEMGEIISHILGAAGPKVGALAGAAPALVRAIRNMITNPTMSAIRGTAGAYQAQPQGIPEYNQLTAPAL